MTGNTIPHWMQTAEITNALAWKRFNQHGIPQKKQHERFRYADFSILENEHFETATPSLSQSYLSIINDYRQVYPDAILLVQVNGVFIPKVSDLKHLPHEIEILDLSQPDCYTDQWNFAWNLTKKNYYPFADWNSGSCQQGLFVYLAENCICPLPLHLLSIVTAAQSFYQRKNAILLGKHSQLTVIEHHVTSLTQPYVNNEVLHIQLQHGATLNHYKLQSQTTSGIRLMHTFVEQHAGSQYDYTNATLGSLLSREELSIDLLGALARCHTKSVYLLSKEKQYFDQHIDIQHLAPQTHSNMLYKGIIEKNARAVFNGKLFVAPQAQKMTAYQANHHLLLSSLAEANSKPELEIYADDVQCKHGATTGQLNDEALFYLQTRGLTLVQAKTLLLQAFVKEVLDTVSLSTIQTQMQTLFGCAYVD